MKISVTIFKQKKNQKNCLYVCEKCKNSFVLSLFVRNWTAAVTPIKSHLLRYIIIHKIPSVVKVDNTWEI